MQGFALVYRALVPQFRNATGHTDAHYGQRLILAALGSFGTCSRLVFDHAQNVGLLEDKKLFAFDHDVRAGPFAAQYAITDRDLHRNNSAIFIT